MKKTRNVRILTAMAFCQGLVFYSPVATLYRLSCSLSMFDISTIESISFAVSMALEVPWGIVADRIGYRKVMIASSLIYLASKVVFLLAYGYPMFLFERILLASALSGLSGVDESMLYLSAGEDGEKAFAAISTATASGLVVPSLFLLAFPHAGYRMLALLTVASYAANLALSFSLDETLAERSREEVRQRGREFPDPRLLLPVLPIALLSSVMAEGGNYLTVFLSQVRLTFLGGGTGILAVSSIILTASGLASALSPRLARLVGGGRLLFLLPLLLALSSAVAGLSSSTAAVLPALAIARASYAMFAPRSALAIQQALCVEDRATALSALSMISSLAAFVAMPFIGRLADMDHRLPFLAVSLAAIAMDLVHARTKIDRTG